MLLRTQFWPILRNTVDVILFMTGKVVFKIHLNVPSYTIFLFVTQNQLFSNRRDDGWETRCTWTNCFCQDVFHTSVEPATDTCSHFQKKFWFFCFHSEHKDITLIEAMYQLSCWHLPTLLQIFHLYLLLVRVRPRFI